MKSRVATEPTVDLDYFLSQPNINMVIPWIYEIYTTMKSNSTTSRDTSDTPVELEKFLNQPNINMTIPWIYEIYQQVKSGNIGGSGSGSSSSYDGYTIEDLT